MAEDDRILAGNILAKAYKDITTERGGQHGDVNTSFTMIGDFWRIYDKEVVRRGGDPYEAEHILRKMALLKTARQVCGDKTIADHYSDEAGYSALAGMVAGAKLA